MINQSSWDKKVTVIMKKFGAFFAFSKKQFEERADPNLEYATMGSGMITPKENARSMMDEMNAAFDEHVKQTLSEHSVDKLIDHELANYECQIVNDWSDAADALKPFGIKPEQVKARFPAYMQKCIDNDWF